MKLPAFLLLKPVQYAAGILAIVTVVGLWYRGKIKDAEARGANEQLMAANDSLQRQNQIDRDSAAVIVEATRDSLLQARLRSDVVRRAAGTATVNYETQRRPINVNAPQPAGVPAGHIVVPIAFVQAADSMAKMIPDLLTQMALERAASQRRIDALLFADSLKDVAIRLKDERIVQLGVALEASKPSVMDRVKDAAIGGALIYGAVQLLGGRK